MYVGLCRFCLMFVWVLLMFVYALFDVCVCRFYLMFVYVLFDVCVCFV